MPACDQYVCSLMSLHGRKSGMARSLGRAMLIGFFLAVVLTSESAFGQDVMTDISFYGFSGSNGSLSLLGDASISIDDLALELTQTSSGKALYETPVQFIDPSGQTSISFNTTFIFSIETVLTDPPSSGEGLAFIISSDNSTIGSSGPWLGVLQASTLNPSVAATGSQRTVAVEFDIHQDAEFLDINDNHVGLDINSLDSVNAQAAASDSVPVELFSGDHIQAWVQYDSQIHQLNISISQFTNTDFPKPQEPLLSVEIDLSTVVNEYMYVGFSGATGNGTVHHKVWSWKFQSYSGSPGTGSQTLSPSPSPGNNYNPYAPGSSAGLQSFISKPAAVFATMAGLVVALFLS